MLSSSCNTRMSHYRAHLHGNVPFSWENKPGFSKVIDQECPKLRAHGLKLPLPPCPSENPQVQGHDDLQIPLPPCPLPQFPSGSSSRKGVRQLQDDPFLAAYKECTKSKKFASNGDKRRGGRLGVLMSMYWFSCKHSCDAIDDGDARDDGLLKLSGLPPVPRNR